MTRHVPVMMREAIDGLDLREGMTVVDATFGGGGYTAEILRRIGAQGTVVAMDRDESAIARCQEKYGADHRVHGVHSNYSRIRTVLKEAGIASVDAVVADLGVSSDQLDDAQRGFGFMHAAPLDMRMDARDSRTAATIVNHAPQEEIARIVQLYGDERFAMRIARAIVGARPVADTAQLAEIVSAALPPQARHASRIHPATRTFQALRMAVNEELAHLKTFLTEGIDVVKSGGRIAIVSFHSGEDRVVKNVFRTYARGCICAPDAPICVCGHTPQLRILTKKPIIPTEAEVRINPRARSARLRVAQKV